jgi:hypothetical protein
MSTEFADQKSLIAAGFEGFVSTTSLRDSRCSEVPNRSGVYMVTRKSSEPPKYARKSQGGHFKGKDPTVSPIELELNWVPTAFVMYIGQAGGGGSQSTLRKRLWSFMRFGAGEPVGHWGGRLIWQLEDCSKLTLCWKPTGIIDARSYESELIAGFTRMYGARPFANLRD